MCHIKLSETWYFGKILYLPFLNYEKFYTKRQNGSLDTV